ncbi:MAG: glycosyltransferase family 2 protein, partial [Microthrixaceae bacterium]
MIPVRDQADVIGRAVASVLAQTFAGLEVVVVDDGSSDGSVAAARAVSDGRVRIVRHDPHGVDTARAVGVRRAHGRWVALLDADDEAAPGWLARMGRLI